MNHVTLGWCNEFLLPELTLPKFVAQMEGVFGRFLNHKFHASEKSDHDLTKTNPVPTYVFCDYCCDPGTHTVGEME